MLNEDDEEIGVVTSGTRSPVYASTVACVVWMSLFSWSCRCWVCVCPPPPTSLKKNIGMAYVSKGHFKVGTPIKVRVRNKVSDGVVAKMPFVPANYYKP